MPRKPRRVGNVPRRVLKRLQKLLNDTTAAKSVATGATWRRLHRVESNIVVAMGITRPDTHSPRRRSKRKRAKKAS